MSVAAPKNTLLYQLRGRPLALKRSLADAPITGVAAKIREFRSMFGENVSPETEAVKFYLANHAMKELGFAFDLEEALPDWAMEIADEYHKTAARIAARAFYYLVLITAREARHDHNKSGTIAKAKAKGMSVGALQAMADFPPDHASIPTVTGVFDKYGGKVTIGDLAKSVQFCFYNGQFGGGFGGKKWGVVADCLANYVLGDYTAETMLDTVWTLVHNNGPIFNKGMLYVCHTPALQQVLDIQRAGQIPRLVMAPYGNGKVAAEKFVTKEAVEFAFRVRDKLPGAKDFVAQPVDFAEVQKLGAVGSYHSLIKQLGGHAPEQLTPWQNTSVYKVKGSTAQEPEITEKTHYIIAKHKGLMFKKLTREELVK